MNSTTYEAAIEAEMYRLIDDQGRERDLASCDRVIAGLIELQSRVGEDSYNYRSIAAQLGSFVGMRDQNIRNGHWPDPDHWSRCVDHGG